jgi:hypothetical protein
MKTERTPTPQAEYIKGSLRVKGQFLTKGVWCGYTFPDS